MKFPDHSVLKLSDMQSEQLKQALESRTVHLQFFTEWCTSGCNLVVLLPKTSVGSEVWKADLWGIQIHINIGFHDDPHWTWDSVSDVEGDAYTDIPVEIMGAWPNGFAARTVADDLPGVFQFLADNIAEMEADFIRTAKANMPQ